MLLDCQNCIEEKCKNKPLELCHNIGHILLREGLRLSTGIRILPDLIMPMHIPLHKVQHRPHRHKVVVHISVLVVSCW